MDSLTPDYKTIAEFRRENIRPLQKLFREFVQLCKSWELIGSELIVADGTKIKASNNKKMNFSRKKLDARLSRLDEQIKQFLEESEKTDKDENDKIEVGTIALNKLLERRDKYEAYKKQLDETGENEISLVDPDARLMGNNRGGVDMAYNVQSAVDGKHHIIIEYDVSLNPSDQHQLPNMVKKIKRKLKLSRYTLLADKGYYNGEDLLKLKKLKVKVIIAKQKPSDSKKLSAEYRSDKFTYDAKADTYTCPTGQLLYLHNKKQAKRHNYFNKAACVACPNRDKCIIGKTKYRTVTRSQYAVIYDESDKRYAENSELYKLRQQVVEHPFGTVKYTMHGGHFFLRTRRKVSAEVALLFLGYNLKRAVKILGFDGIMIRLDSLLRQILRTLKMLCINPYISRFPYVRISVL